MKTMPCNENRAQRPMPVLVTLETFLAATQVSASCSQRPPSPQPRGVSGGVLRRTAPRSCPVDRVAQDR